MSPQYGELPPANGWDRFGSLGHPSKFQRVSHLAFVTAAMSLTDGGQQTLHDVWPSAGLVYHIYIYGGSCFLTEFCQVQNSFCVQVLRSPVLAGLLHGPEQWASATKLCGTVQRMKFWNFRSASFFLQTAPPIPFVMPSTLWTKRCASFESKFSSSENVFCKITRYTF